MARQQYRKISPLNALLDIGSSYGMDSRKSQIGLQQYFFPEIILFNFGQTLLSYGTQLWAP